MKTPEELRAYRLQYYKEHKEQALRNYHNWCKANPKLVKAIQKRWYDAHPHYYRNYIRKRKAVSEPFIFQFLDNGTFDGDVNSFVSYLRDRGVPEKHIQWFQVDVKKYLEKEDGI